MVLFGHVLGVYGLNVNNLMGQMWDELVGI